MIQKTTLLDEDENLYVVDEVWKKYISKYDIKKLEIDTGGVFKEWAIKNIIRYGNTVLSWNSVRTMENGKVFPKVPGEEALKDLEKDVSKLLHFPVKVKYNSEIKYVDPDLFKKEYMINSDIVITRQITRAQLLKELNEL